MRSGGTDHPECLADFQPEAARGCPPPQRVAAMYFLDAGTQDANHGPMLSRAMRLVPLITHLPGGRSFVRDRFLAELHRNAGHKEWLDADTERRYTEPVLDRIGRVVALASRLANAQEPESLATVISRIHVPITVLLGDAPLTAGAGTEEIDALAPLGSLVRIEHLAGIGHFPHEEAPNDLLRYLLPPPAAHRPPPTVAVAQPAIDGGVR